MTQKSSTQHDAGSNVPNDEKNPNSHENDDDETSSFTKHLIDTFAAMSASPDVTPDSHPPSIRASVADPDVAICLLYTSDAADE